MHQQRHPLPGHGFEHGIDAADVGDTGVRIGCGTSRIELATLHHTARLCRCDLCRRRAIGEVQRHQRLEAAAWRQRRQDALAIGQCKGRGGDRWHQVRHHDGATELLCRMGQHCSQLRAITQVQMPVIGGAKGQSVHSSCCPGPALQRRGCVGRKGGITWRGFA
jgi:hypothetical protein